MDMDDNGWKWLEFAWLTGEGEEEGGVVPRPEICGKFCGGPSWKDGGGTPLLLFPAWHPFRGRGGGQGVSIRVSSLMYSRILRKNWNEDGRSKPADNITVRTNEKSKKCHNVTLHLFYPQYTIIYKVFHD
mgnify:CR=1 FL=1